MIPSEFNGLLGSRICHDLISPIGAINNGLELLGMTGQADTPELALIHDSVEAANARIRLFRLAFGAAEAGQRTAWGEIEGIVDRMSQGRIAIEWLTPSDMDRSEARLSLLLLLCAETLMPFGGSVVVTPGPAIVMNLVSDRLRADQDLLRQLSDWDAPIPAASDVHFALARHAADDVDRKIDVETTEDGLKITA
ncbi:histidine phosphotransferase family protein [Palleronia abyssalis]|uniref:Histidine phosphotransferase ChpT C-terminal domain-containing protein n=1 Tax=Palleronia abyssalis TaxID=1501240 RepID=A0A2R8BPX9_9RHOB|nr:histidine phosphotransferase family protein [Palleronia abyssalis]SPJ22232.1 hypothetical protein PAA8504_00020 [Palleronia abyssalis]